MKRGMEMKASTSSAAAKNVAGYNNWLNILCQVLVESNCGIIITQHVIETT